MRVALLPQRQFHPRVDDVQVRVTGGFGLGGGYASDGIIFSAGELDFKGLVEGASCTQRVCCSRNLGVGHVVVGEAKRALLPPGSGLRRVGMLLRKKSLV
jgi:hypothetical protein